MVAAATRYGRVGENPAMTDVPYEELDPPVRKLVRILNEYDDVETLGSCGGHETPMSGNSAPANEWWVMFWLKPANREVTLATMHDLDVSAIPSESGWFHLEQLVYWINERLGRKRAVVLRPIAVPPHLNGPGSLRFELDGYRDGDDGIEPDEVADFIRRIPEMIDEDAAAADKNIQRLIDEVGGAS
ncbi:MAG TPA: hypothetical protein VII82_07365 [Polyangiaceae bacterium]